MAARGPVVERAKGHEDFLIFRDAILRSKDDRASVSQVKQIAVRVPYEFIREAEREDVGALIVIKRGVKGGGDKFLTDIQTVHVEDRRGVGRIAGIAILKGIYPACITSEDVVRGVGGEACAGEEAKFTRYAGGGLDRKKAVRRVQTMGKDVGVTGEKGARIGGEGV